MKRAARSRILVPALLVSFLALAGCGGGAAQPAAPADAKVTLRVGHAVAATDVVNVSLDAWGKALNKATNGSVEVKLFPNSQLGGEMEMVQQVSSGNLEVVVTGNTGFDPINALYAPYAFSSARHLQTALEKEVMKPFLEEFRTKQGLRFMGYLERSPRNMTANKLVKAPDDVKGLKLRAPQVEVIVSAWKAVGANVTPLAFPELFQALQSGTVDAQENPVELIYNSKFYEVQKYLITTEHSYAPFLAFINDKVWDKMSDAQRKAVQDTFKDAVVQHRERLAKTVAELTGRLKEKGMQVIEPDRKAFRTVMWTNASRPFMVKAWGEDVVKQLEALAD